MCTNLCCTVLAALLALLVAIAPWVCQRIFWYTSRPPSGQKIHAPRFPPDFHSNVVRGIPTSAFITDNRMDFLEKEFVHVPGDVWVVTYQKVGTTWTQFIVTLLLGHPDPGSGCREFRHLNECPTEVSGDRKRSALFQVSLATQGLF